MKSTDNTSERKWGGAILIRKCNILILFALLVILFWASLSFASEKQDLMAKAVGNIHADVAYQSKNFETAYSGKGVIIGIVDTGIDYNHPDFLDENGQTRVLYIWDQTIKSSDKFKAPSEIQNSYGMECDRETLIDGSCPSTDRRGHGTHVAGSAAGDDEKYKGVAPDANLIIVKNHDSTNGEGPLVPSTAEMDGVDIVDAVSYIFEKAKALNMPAVVNLSFASRGSRNDGRSLVDEALTKLVDEDKGRAIVAAAGNGADRPGDGFLSGQHLFIDVADKPVASEVAVLGSSTVDTQIDIWEDAGSELIYTLGIKKADGSYIQLPWSTKGSVVSEVVDEGRLSVSINSLEVKNAQNGFSHVTITALGRTDQVEVEGKKVYLFELLASGKGSAHAWLGGSEAFFTTKNGDSYSEDWRYVAGDGNYTVNSPATAKGVISVGAYVTDNFRLYDYKIGDIAPYSSVGPSMDSDYTGPVPEITAPGEMIAATLSRDMVDEYVKEQKKFIMDDGEHIRWGGTSMSSPIVAGVVALVFERDSNLTYEQVRQLIDATASVDGFVGDTPNDVWGYGKIDVDGIMKNFDLAYEASDSINFGQSAPKNLDAGSGCILVKDLRYKNALGVFAILLSFGLILRKRVYLS